MFTNSQQVPKKKQFRLRIDLTAFLVALILLLTGFYLVKSQVHISWWRQIKSRLVSLMAPNVSQTIWQDQRIVREESAVIDLVEKASPAVVSIVTKEVGFDPFSGPYSQDSGVGTGFIIKSDGLILTNSHVVDSTGNYTVVLSDERTFEVKKVHLDRINDLAILEVTASNLPTVGLGDSGSLKVGQSVVAIGNALGRFSNTVTTGVVSGIARQVTASSGWGSSSKTFENVIQTDAALNPGNSGGPLLNLAGQVIGINVATTSSADNIGFAIPINIAKPIIADFETYGKISRPFIGVQYAMVSKDMASLKRLPEGAFVQQIVKGSPADKAGLKVGDIITRFDGQQINETSGLSSYVQEKKVGDRVEVVIDREGKESKVTLVLEDAEKYLKE